MERLSRLKTLPKAVGYASFPFQIDTTSNRLENRMGQHCSRSHQRFNRTAVLAEGLSQWASRTPRSALVRMWPSTTLTCLRERCHAGAVAFSTPAPAGRVAAVRDRSRTVCGEAGAFSLRCRHREIDAFSGNMGPSLPGRLTGALRAFSASGTSGCSRYASALPSKARARPSTASTRRPRDRAESRKTSGSIAGRHASSRRWPG